MFSLELPSLFEQAWLLGLDARILAECDAPINYE
jgi:hypothetical protein